MSTDTVKTFYSQNSQQRFDATVDGAKANQALWTLADDEGCVVLESDQERCLLMWHEEEFAQSWATGEYSSCKALKIEMNDFLEKWVPGMTNDGFDLAIAPSLAGEGIVLSPEEFADDLA
ncbi:DUF2750 domain-containing protein [Ferrimonas lipolytica]|uniref:DUF2750 domain-containing protein n=1 Tax=Ferrimonas lipolytica TaxID=2724191 RepID=A0A6H1UDQ0_9GAMM|nr:DUF2750 domain-containing protein [Ferrimonas lipolytica]QIZ76968.1 DUF2750 domain-containing protein [Ferrimonas lipolytica]